ncbi:unnamed protein product, partial [Adineta steineri]
MHLMKFNVFDAVKLLREHSRHNQSVESLSMIMLPVINQHLRNQDENRYSMQQ